MRDLISKIESQDQLLQDRKETIRELEESFECRVLATTSQYGDTIRQNQLLESDIASQNKKMETLNEENEQLREQCATLSDELNTVRDNQLEAENEGSVWETALNEAVAKTKKSLDERKEQMDT